MIAEALLNLRLLARNSIIPLHSKKGEAIKAIKNDMTFSHILHDYNNILQAQAKEEALREPEKNLQSNMSKEELDKLYQLRLKQMGM